MAEHCLHSTEILFQSFPIGSDNYSYWKNMVISNRDWKHSFFFFLAIGLCYFFTIQTVIAWFTPEYSRVPSFACFRWLFWRTPRTLKLLNQVRPCSLYSFHSEQAEQKSSALEHLCWRTPEYSVFRGGVDRTVTWPVPKQDGGALPACVGIFASLDLFRSTPKCPVLLVMWLFWCTPSTLKIAKSSPP